jgi:hemoglobin/transferrin/lactoferrin receptor protein
MRTLVVGLALLLAGAPAQADEEPTPQTGYVDEIVVTATRIDTPVGKTPAAVSVVTGDELALTHSASSFPDVLAFVPGVMVQKTTRGFGSPYIRGFTGFRSLTLIDGIRLNNSTFRDGPNQYDGTIDLFDLERAEVTRGPGSVLHGSDAVGGTVQVVPRIAEPGAADLGTARVLYRGATGEGSNAGHVSYENGSSHWAGMLGATYRTMDDLVAGDGTARQRGTGFDELGFNGNATVDLGEAARLTFAGQHFQQDDVSRFHRTVQSRGWEGTEPGTDQSNRFDQRRTLLYTRLSFEPGAAFLSRGRLTLSAQRQEEDNDRVSGSSARTVQGFTVDTYGADLQLDVDVGRLRLTYGYEGYLDLADSYRDSYGADGTLTSRDVQGPIGDDASYWNHGVYLQGRLALTERTTLQGGVRYDIASLVADRVKDPVTNSAVSVSDEWSAVVGDVRVIQGLVGGLQAYGAVSQGFRSPNLADMTTFDLAEQGQVEVPSFDLSPERFLSFEVGLKGSGRILSGQLAVFRTNISDMIDRYFTGEAVTLPSGQTASVVRRANVAEGHVQGVEVEGSVQLPRGLQLGGHFFWTRGEADTTVVEDGVARLERHPLSRVAPPTGALRLRWSPQWRRSWIEAELQMAAKQEELSLKDRADTTRIPPGGTPGYAVVHLRGGLQVARWMDVLATVRNVADADYRVHGSGINEPGFGLELGARFTFGP